MKARFLSREFAVRRVFTGLLVAGACLVGFVAFALVGRYIERTWYGPWRSARILQGLNVQTHTLEEQLEIICQAMARDHRNPDARFWFAWKLTAMKKYDDAAAAWAYVEKWDTGRRRDTSLCDRGMCLLFARQPAKAIVYLEETIRRCPDHVSARGFLAAAYADLGLPYRVEEELVKLANLKPCWQQQFETCPEWPEEHQAALVKLQPYLKEAKRVGIPGDSGDTILHSERFADPEGWVR
jgi:tetratricopeptide (TPR) repeat protein